MRSFLNCGIKGGLASWSVEQPRLDDNSTSQLRNTFPQFWGAGKNSLPKIFEVSPRLSSLKQKKSWTFFWKEKTWILPYPSEPQKKQYIGYFQAWYPGCLWRGCPIIDDFMCPGPKMVKSRVLWGMVIPPLMTRILMSCIQTLRNWVEDHPLSWGNNGSLDPSTCDSCSRWKWLKRIVSP